MQQKRVSKVAHDVSHSMIGDNGIEFEPDQRLVEAIIDGLGLKGSNTTTTPGTKPKPVQRSEQQLMMERRMSGEEGSNCIIANLRSQLGQLELALKEAIEARVGTKVGKEEIKEWLQNLPSPNHKEGANYQESANFPIKNEDFCNTAHDSETQGNCDDLGTSHLGSPGAEEESIEGEMAEGEPLESQARSVYQTQAARANYLCMDRPENGFAVEEAMRKLSNPTKDDEVALKRVGNFLLGKLSQCQ